MKYLDIISLFPAEISPSIIILNLISFSGSRFELNEGYEDTLEIKELSFDSYMLLSEYLKLGLDDSGSGSKLY